MTTFLFLAHRVIGKTFVLEDDKDHTSSVDVLITRVLVKSEDAYIIGECINFDGEFLLEDIKYLQEEGMKFGLDQWTEAENAFNADNFDPEDWRICDCEICTAPCEGN